jgi:hypothetical protein
LREGTTESGQNAARGFYHARAKKTRKNLLPPQNAERFCKNAQLAYAKNVRNDRNAPRGTRKKGKGPFNVKKAAQSACRCRLPLFRHLSEPFHFDALGQRGTGPENA